MSSSSTRNKMRDVLQNLLSITSALFPKKLCEIACKKTGLALRYVPKELCKIACENNTYILRDVPEEFKTC